MTKTRLTTLSAALALVLSLPAFAQEPVEQSQEPVVEADAEVAATEGAAATADVVESAEPASTGATVESAAPAARRAFADLDTDADGFVSESDLSAEVELSLQFAVADTDHDDRISQAEYDAYHAVREDDDEQEAEE